MAEGSSIDIAYDSVADRLKLVVRDGERALGLLLTRQFVKAVLQRFTDTLQKSAPGGGTDRRAAVVFEHLDALEAVGGGAGGDSGDGGKTSGGGQGGGRAWPGDEAFSLAMQIGVQAREDRFVITIQDANEREQRFALTRAETHRILSAIARKAQAAGWDLEPYMGWLDEAGAARTHLAVGARSAH